MMERKNGMRLPAVVLLAALAFSCFAPAALATAEEPPEDLPAAVSAQDGAQEETTLPGADAAQQDSAAGTGAANPHETIATSVQENPRFAKPQLDIPCRNAILISIDTGDILYEKEPDAEVPMASITKIMTLLLTLEAVEAGNRASSSRWMSLSRPSACAAPTTRPLPWRNLWAAPSRCSPK